MGARFEALDEGVLAAASKSTGYFLAISISQKVWCKNYAKKIIMTCKFFTWGIEKGPIPNFWYTLHAIVANPHSYTYGSSWDTVGEKT